MDDLYSHLNAHHLIFKGINAKGRQDARDQLSKISNLGGTTPNISDIRKLGASNKILVKFNSSKDINFLFANSLKLRNLGISIENDLSPSQREMKNNLLR